MERYVLGFLACRAGDSPSTARQRLSTPMCTRIRHMGCAHFLPLPRYFLHRPDGTLRAPLFGLQGGGVYVASNGVANFEGCDIHDNTAYYVCLPSALALNFHPSPQWNVMPSTFGLQGGGVYVFSDVVANFESCNIHDNTAAYVCLHSEPSVTFHPSPP